jgi:hypothetical protein
LSKIMFNKNLNHQKNNHVYNQKRLFNPNLNRSRTILQNSQTIMPRRILHPKMFPFQLHN